MRNALYLDLHGNITGQLAVQHFQVPYDTAEEVWLIQLRGVPQPQPLHALL